MLKMILCSCPRLPAHQTPHIRHTYVHAGVHKDSDGKSIIDWLKPWPIPRTEKPASEQLAIVRVLLQIGHLCLVRILTKLTTTTTTRNMNNNSIYTSLKIRLSHHALQTKPRTVTIQNLRTALQTKPKTVTIQGMQTALQTKPQD